jgi:hypothetical protein
MDASRRVKWCTGTGAVCARMISRLGGRRKCARVSTESRANRRPGASPQTDPAPKVWPHWTTMIAGSLGKGKQAQPQVLMTHCLSAVYSFQHVLHGAVIAATLKLEVADRGNLMRRQIWPVGFERQEVLPNLPRQHASVIDAMSCGGEQARQTKLEELAHHAAQGLGIFADLSGACGNRLLIEQTRACHLVEFLLRKDEFGLEFGPGWCWCWLASLSCTHMPPRVTPISERNLL